MARTRIPDEVLTAAHERSRARSERDWAEADRLREAIEAAGWIVVDRGTDFALSPAAPPDIAEGARIRYGSSRNVPSRLGEPPVGLATVVLVATDREAALARAVAGIRAGSLPGVSIVIVADDPSDAQAAALGALDDADVETVWTSVRLGPAVAFDIGLRRASGPVVVRLDSTVEPVGDIVGPLVAALADLTVAIAGGWGSVTADLRTFADGPPGDVDVIDGLAQAFRRADYLTHGPIDPHLRTRGFLDTWWSLAVRDEGDAPPRRAVRVELPAIRHERADHEAADHAGVRDRKRDFYRLIGRFGGRRDLLRGSA